MVTKLTDTSKAALDYTYDIDADIEQGERKSDSGSAGGSGFVRSVMDVGSAGGKSSVGSGV
jgi:hypothetical protein